MLRAARLAVREEPRGKRGRYAKATAHVTGCGLPLRRRPRALVLQVVIWCCLCLHFLSEWVWVEEGPTCGPPLHPVMSDTVSLCVRYLLSIILTATRAHDTTLSYTLVKTGRSTCVLARLL